MARNCISCPFQLENEELLQIPRPPVENEAGKTLPLLHHKI